MLHWPRILFAVSLSIFTLALYSNCILAQEKSSTIEPLSGSTKKSGVTTAARIAQNAKQKSDKALFVDVESAVAQCMVDNDLPGAAVVIVRAGKTIYKKGFGRANVELGTDVDPDKTIFRIGSISKALTLLTLTRQIDQGRIKMDDDVEKYFQGLKNPHEFKKPVTIENLLTHTSGFDQIGGRDRQVREFAKTLAERKALRPALADYLRENRLRRVSPAGEYYRYDTYGSSLAGAILEKVVGKPFPDAIREEMFLPLGMERTFVEVDDDHQSDLAMGYERHGDRNLPQPYEVYVTTPASSIDATPADMGRLLEALTSDGANSTGRFLSAETATKVLKPQFRPHPEFLGTTHGLHESEDASGEFSVAIRSVDHGGTMQGFSTLMTVLPEHKLGVFLAINRSGGRNPLSGAVMRAVVKNLPITNKRKPFMLPARVKTRELGEYVGDYYYGVFCHDGSPEDFAAGAWRRGSPRSVEQNSGALSIGDEEFLPRGDDVFVRTDGQQMIVFGRDQAGHVSHFNYSTSPDTFERALAERR